MFSEESVTKNYNRLEKQIWKLIPMKQNDENWKEHLKTIISELEGLSQIIKDDYNLLIVVSKLKGLPFVEEQDFAIYKKIVFRCISLLKVYKDIE